MDYYKLKILNNKKKIIIVLIIISIIGSLVYYFMFYHPEESSIEEEVTLQEEDINIHSNEDIIVDIKGQVANPGVYSFKLEYNPRINDLINKAGGLTKEADTSTINLSKKLEDEMTIIIYSKKEIENYVKTQNELKTKLELCENKLKNNACINAKSEVKTNNKVNINEASIEELITIPGIGESKAKAIIEYRNNNRFNSIDDIKNVEGIGDSLFASIKESITV